MRVHKGLCCAIPIADLSILARDGFYYATRRQSDVRRRTISTLSIDLQIWNPAMQKVIEFPDMASSGRRAGPCSQPDGGVESAVSAPPSIEPIWTVVDSLSRTLESIKAMCATAPSGPLREKLEIERTNLVIGLFVARIAAMRVTLDEPAPVDLAEPSLPIARRG